MFAAGSSPPVRGSGRAINPCISPMRFIPACAGIGMPDISAPTLPPVHPRLCGDRSSRDCLPSRLRGSSPPVRGSEINPNRLIAALRFIPACAGIGFCNWDSTGWQAVHPRLCGDRLAVNSQFSAVHRFIPACAGIGYRRYRLVLSNAVHPRLCGDRCNRSADVMSVSGSSPPVRGSVLNNNYGASDNRFIPACAGIGPARSKPKHRYTVHPRLCGDRVDVIIGTFTITGSSPPVRGSGYLPSPNCL